MSNFFSCSSGDENENNYNLPKLMMTNSVG